MSKRGLGLNIKTVIYLLLLALIASLLYIGWTRISGSIFG